ncbi:DUF2793 domain-containing protein [Sphingopyxis sp.]|uniref:DUF2793 domain-containing protein n=1 Tax=Sphingopyxis sp. TaxID=1908224 RepID=UPI0025F99393|nr:DUF2793 domain-containing protein [Sphingopyxis sp.]MBK6411977.1 DUF2793 domain-containing protein [Sphingopyxis sp.]
MTRRLALPLLRVAQAEKVTHNGALTLIDSLVHAAVEVRPLNDPPADPDSKRCWLVGAVPAGDWIGQGNAIAIRTIGG